MNPFRPLSRGTLPALFVLIAACLAPMRVPAEQMLELFNCTWNQVIQKMPEIAEAGYDSLWLPNPAKGASGGYSVGYDQFDPFDLGSINQAGTVPTMYGTQAQLLQLVQVAHRFGIRVYFDNIMNHRGTTVPGYDSNTPTNFYPGLSPLDFHLQTGPGGHYTNWPGIQDYNNQFDVQNEPLSGLVDLANEPGSVNLNFGLTLGSQTNKPVYIRQPFNTSYYMNTNLPSIGGPWHPFAGPGQPVAEDSTAYLIRAAMWTLYTTKCDGFRLDAVKHTPSNFFGDSYPTFNGYCGGIQAMFDYTHGYGSNVTFNGYVEADDMRNSCFDSEVPRNDALLFGEHLGAPPTMTEYINTGMRLLNTPLHNNMNNNLGASTGLSGLDSPGYIPYSGAFPVTQGVQYAQNQDASGSYAAHRDLQDAYYSLQQGIPVIYTDNYNQSGPPSYFPSVASANTFGEFSDNQMPELAWLHNQLARGQTWPRWSDTDVVCFERYDNREGSASAPQNQDVVLFAMDDNYGFPGDVTFDDGVTRLSDGYYGTMGVSGNSRSVGLAVGFPPGSVLVQMVKTSSGVSRAYSKLLVHGATQSLSAAQSTANDPTPQNRLIYVGGQTLATNGGAVELTIPSGGYLMYAYQWPETSRVSLRDAITLRQGGQDAPRLTVYRTDGTNGDTHYNPSFPFLMRGSIDQYGNLKGGANVSNLTYSIDVPVLTNAPFDFVIRNDASSANCLIKLDGGVDINSQMGLGVTNGTDLRDNRPGYATDVFLGYEQAGTNFQNGPEKFAARNSLSNNIISLAAETYYYTVGSGPPSVVNGSGYGQGITNQTAAWVCHDPAAAPTALGTNAPTQLFPATASASQPEQVRFRIGYQFQVNTANVYYTTDGSNPDGAFGVGLGTTQIVPAFFVNHDSATNNIDWWGAVIPAQPNGTQVRYKIAAYYKNIAAPIPDSEPSGSKLYGVTQYSITNFNPVTAPVWLHNDLNTNNTAIGLQEGFHIVRARTFLPRSGKSSVFNTFLQTFYYDAGLPSGVIAVPGADGLTLTNSTYQFAIRCDSTVTGVSYNIADGSANNDDTVTGYPNGNGSSNGAPLFVAAQSVSPTGALNQQYPSLPQEYRFNYAAIPGSGAAVITIRLAKITTAVNTNRFTTLTRTVNLAAPAQSLAISAPAANGQVIYLNPANTNVIQACFSASLTSSDTSPFSVSVNGVTQPRTNSNGSSRFHLATTSACGYGLNQITYDWKTPAPGANQIQVVFNNGSLSLSDTRQVTVINPSFSLNALTGDSAGRSLSWSTLSNLNYQVLATTNLNLPFQPLSSIIPGNGGTAFYFDANPDPVAKFYQVVIVP